MALIEAGHSVSDTARRIGVARTTIQRLKRKVAETGNLQHRPRSGRPRVSTVRQDRVLRRMSVQQPRAVARTLRQRWSQENGIDASTRTVSRRLGQMGLHGRVARKKPLLTATHRQVRLQWAKDRRNWDINRWRQHFFTDETPIHLIQSRQQRYVRRPVGKATLQQYSRPTVHSGGGKLDVWGGFAADGTRAFQVLHGTINTERYIEMLQAAVVPMDLAGQGLTMQQDNAPAHKSRRTLQFMENNGIRLLPWPPQSPDLNPIENLWAILKSRLENLDIHGMDQLVVAARREWDAIPPETLANLVASMPRRIQAVIQAQGGPTRF